MPTSQTPFDTTVRIELSRAVTVREFRDVIEAAYGAYCAVDLVFGYTEAALTMLLYEMQADHGPRAVTLGVYRAMLEQILERLEYPPGLHPMEEPMIGRARFDSPGWWEMIGTWNPIKQIVDYLKFRAEHRETEKINELKRYQLSLKNMILETEVIEARMNLLRELGFDDQRLFALLDRQLIAPLENLASFQDSGLIKTIQSTRRDQPASHRSEGEQGADGNPH